MKKILFAPLDERPCNYDFPQMLVRDTDYELVVPPRELYGKKKAPGNVGAIWEWIFEHAAGCGDAVLSMDALLYGGLIPSRLHHYRVEELLQRLENLKRLKAAVPSLAIYAFSNIMRNPTYSSDDEEPDYYAQWGREIHNFGVISHKQELGIANEAERNELEIIRRDLPQEYLQDYLDRRSKNSEANKNVVRLVKDGIVDFLILSQDDSSPYGLTAKDQQSIRQTASDLQVNLKAFIYPDSDATANTLIARAINRGEKRKPAVFVKYSSSAGSMVVPLYEDRMVGETIKYQILAAGGFVVTSAAEADIVLMINVPGGAMQDYLQDEIYSQMVRPAPQYDANRNMIEFVEYADYACKTLGKSVIMGDIAYANGGDPLLLSLLKQMDLVWRLAGYAGWNTSSNTLGTCIPMGMIFDIYGDTKAHGDFLALRYMEDIGYCACVRKKVTVRLTDMNIHIDRLGENTQRASAFVKKELQDYADRNLTDGSRSVKITGCCLPWNRLFEVGLQVEAVLRHSSEN